MEAPQDHDKMIEEPLLSKPKGGFKTMPFIIANEAFEKVASYGLMPNMILYLTREYGLGAAEAANALFFWSAGINFTPILGAFVADSYVGRYWMIGFGSIASLLGVFILWLTAVIPIARPQQCTQLISCESATPLQLLLLYSSLAIMSIGAGGIRSCSMAFGANQLIRDNLKDAGLRETFFSWYYVSVAVSIVIAMTIIVYIQDAFGWSVGFGVPVLLMLFSLVSFFMASHLYIKSKANESLLTGLVQVLTAAYKNRGIQLEFQSTDHILYHSREGSVLSALSEEFLNKACIIRNPEKDLTPDGRASDPWSLCTVDQVEELKAIIKIIPIWSAGMIASVTVTQGSFFILQATTMDRHITSNFQIPAGSVTVFMVGSIAVGIAIYDRVIVPLASRIKGKSCRLSLKQRMGVGILLSSMSMVAFAISERVRRETAIEEGYLDEPNAVVNMSVMWLLPGLILNGFTEAFNGIGQNEFFYTELPTSMASIATTLYWTGLSVASLVASLIMSIIDYVTTRGGKESWISTNLNKGHYDYYYWVLAIMSLANFAYYYACCKTYGTSRADGGMAVEERNKE
ncbi:hypothetical protein K2173_016421 [Erythroxylum novogranatense]|uniref:NPF family transporter n=1 Tax=Erythroxylum novogranatense TaxID=1862640 RepID=A0AAV8SGC1_9ROSI|nr:hypothetical protein K2173_016421 [Erythroxylum novogranatense]